jgi:hypothetical protein
MTDTRRKFVVTTDDIKDNTLRQNGPLIGLNRLSRDKGDLPPAEQLAKNQVIIEQQMMPLLLGPDPQKDVDYVLLQDFASGESSHEEGGPLYQAFELIKTGRFKGLAAPDVTRITRSDEGAAQLVKLCKQYRICLYTDSRGREPYRLWNPADEIELKPLLFGGQLELLFFKMRIANARKKCLPYETTTGVWRFGEEKKGWGRYFNGKTPYGYRWEHKSKSVAADDEIPDKVYIPPGEFTPARKTKFEIARRILTLGFEGGCKSIHDRILEETGVKVSVNIISAMLRNPFYAGRPTSFWEGNGTRREQRRREVPLQTIGTYPRAIEWERFLELQDTIDQRSSATALYGSKAWAARIVRCPCGHPYIGDGNFYGCREYIHHASNTNPNLRRGAMYKLDPDWVQTETCGRINKEKVHRLIEATLRAVFADPDLKERLDVWQEALKNSDRRKSVANERKRVEKELADTQKRRDNLYEMLEWGDPSDRKEAKARLCRLKAEKEALSVKKARLSELENTPELSPSVYYAILEAMSEGFDTFWSKASAQFKSALCRTLLDHIKIEGKDQNKRLTQVHLAGPLRAEFDPKGSGNAARLSKVAQVNDSTIVF